MQGTTSVQPIPTEEPEVHRNAEPWLETLCKLMGRYSSSAFHAATFSGRLSAMTVCGFNAVDVSVNGVTVERTARDARLNDFDHFCATFQLAGVSTQMMQSDIGMEFGVGGLAISNTARPMIYKSSDLDGRWLSVKLPRSELISHLGFEPRLDRVRREPRLQRLLFDMVSNAVDIETRDVSAWMKLAFYDLVGAMCVCPDRKKTTLHSDKIFDRVCEIARHRFADPNINGHEVAAEAGISIRYLQTLFTMRGSTFGHFITALRLDFAANLIRRRALTDSGQPLSSIAYASGYRDYTHFARGYRRRFGCVPGATAAGPV